MHAFHMRERIKALRKAAELAEASARSFAARGQHQLARAKIEFAVVMRTRAALVERGAVR